MAEAVDQADDLAAFYAEDWSSIARHPERHAAWLSAQFQRRDNLESVRLVLFLARPTPPDADSPDLLDALLQQVDDTAITRLTELSEWSANLTEDWLEDHRGAVAWQEPLAWWPLR
jgi:hypothetical protein